jgi:hypothetical protein
VSGVTEFGLGAHFLKFSREYRRQADILWTHIMADAGFDPREMASMFQTIQKQGGSGGPEFLSSHPDPGNRAAAITKEAAMLQVRNPVRDVSPLQQARARLSQLPTAPSADDENGERGLIRGLRPEPAGRSIHAGCRRLRPRTPHMFRISVPSNWRELPSNDTVTFAPDGAYGDADGQGVVTHGMVIGAMRSQGQPPDSDGRIRGIALTGQSQPEQTLGLHPTQLGRTAVAADGRVQPVSRRRSRRAAGHFLDNARRRKPLLRDWRRARRGLCRLRRDLPEGHRVNCVRSVS